MSYGSKLELDGKKQSLTLNQNDDLIAPQGHAWNFSSTSLPC